MNLLVVALIFGHLAVFVRLGALRKSIVFGFVVFELGVRELSLHCGMTEDDDARSGRLRREGVRLIGRNSKVGTGGRNCDARSQVALAGRSRAPEYCAQASEQISLSEL